MFAFLILAVDERNSVRLCPPAYAAAEAAGHPHKVRIVQFCIRTVMQNSPPGTKTTGRIAKSEVRIQNDTIDAVVTTVE